MIEKIKKSIDFEKESIRLLEYEKSKIHQSNSFIVNNLIQTFLGIPDDVKKTIFYLFHEQSENENENENWNIRSKQHVAIWNRLKKYFETDQIPIPKGMKKITLKNGYLLIPDNWDVLDDVGAGKWSECEYAGVAELYSKAADFEVQNIVFPTNKKYGNEWDDKFFNEAKQKCIDSNKTLKENAIICEKWLGLWSLPVFGDPAFWNKYNPNYCPPAGAVIIKNNIDTISEK